MSLLNEDLARAHISLRLEEARAFRRADLVARAQRAAMRAEKKSMQARILLARAVSSP